MLDSARRLLGSVGGLIAERGITLIGITLANLERDDAVQLTLPFDGHHDELLDHALDQVRARFGSTALSRAVLVNRDAGVEMPLLPD